MVVATTPSIRYCSMRNGLWSRRAACGFRSRARRESVPVHGCAGRGRAAEASQARTAGQGRERVADAAERRRRVPRSCRSGQGRLVHEPDTAGDYGERGARAAYSVLIELGGCGSRSPMRSTSSPAAWRRRRSSPSIRNSTKRTSARRSATRRRSSGRRIFICIPR